METIELSYIFFNNQFISQYIIDNKIDINTIKIYHSLNNWTTPILYTDHNFSINTILFYIINKKATNIKFIIKINDKDILLPNHLIINNKSKFYNIIITKDKYLYNGNIKIKQYRYLLNQY